MAAAKDTSELMDDMFDARRELEGGLSSWDGWECVADAIHASERISAAAKRLAESSAQLAKALRSS